MKISNKAKIKYVCAFILMLKPKMGVCELTNVCVYVHIHTLVCKMVFYSCNINRLLTDIYCLCVTVVERR